MAQSFDLRVLQTAHRRTGECDLMKTIVCDLVGRDAEICWHQTEVGGGGIEVLGVVHGFGAIVNHVD